MDAHKNFALSTVATAPSPATSGTSLVVATGHGARFPAAPFNVTIWPAGAAPDPTNAEIVRVTAVSTDTLTIVRAQEGTSARTVVVGDQIVATVTAKTLTDVESIQGWAALVAAKTANYTATIADEFIPVNAASGAITITLPAASTCAITVNGVVYGKSMTIKKVDIGTNIVTINPNGSELIDGALTLDILDYLEAVTIMCDGSAWWAV